MPKTTAVPADLLAPDGSGTLPTIERDHVQRVYDAVAEQWHGTRYKAWPRVVDFIDALPPHSLVADLGCGNGKMAPACRAAGHGAIGCDFSSELVRIAALEQHLDAQVADVMALPYRSGQFDAALSIAVLHHVSTPERRQLLVTETLRVLRPGGRALFYAWAAEQAEGGRSGHEFEAPDVFVAFHSRLTGPKQPKRAGPKASALGMPSPTATDVGGAASSADQQSDAVAALEAMGGIFDESKRAVVFQRYCHVYREGELRALILEAGGATILDEYYDTGNWCAVVQKHET